MFQGRMLVSRHPKNPGVSREEIRPRILFFSDKIGTLNPRESFGFLGTISARDFRCTQFFFGPPKNSVP